MRSSFITFLCCAVLSATAALGQSFSIVKTEPGKYLIEARPPADTPHDLQSSDDLQRWLDIRTEILEPYAFTFDISGIVQRYFRLIPSLPPAPPIRVLLLGDSMTSDCCGWGGGVYGYFKPNATVINYGTAWASTKVFLQSEEYDKMLLIKPDYVLMQYGFIDSGGDPDRGTTLEEYEANLRTIVGAIRGFGGIPIMITMHAPRSFDAQGKVIPRPPEHDDVMRRTAAELNTPLVDLNKLSLDVLNGLGPVRSAVFNYVPEDVLHLSPLGARYHSWLIVNALPASLAPYLTGILEPPLVP